MKTPSIKTQYAFDQWTNTFTWTTGHWCDDQRFYDFVHAAHAENLDAETLHDLLKSKIKAKYSEWEDSLSDEAISRALIRFEDLVGFLKHIEYNQFHH